MNYPYQPYIISSSTLVPQGELYRPEIPVRVIGVRGDASFLALVDTGADITIVPRKIGERIGVEYEDKPSWPMVGVGGKELDVKVGRIEMEVSDKQEKHRWASYVGFVAFGNPEDEKAILGHAGFLEYFTAGFDGEKRELRLEVNQQLRQAVSNG